MCIRMQRDTLRLDLDSQYMVIFHNYGLDVENVQRTFEQLKASPPLPRNAPPVAGAIAWARQLLRRVEGPMQNFQQNPVQMMNPRESRQIIAMYNKTAQALLEYEERWISAWETSIEKVKEGLKATLLIRQGEQLHVNFDPQVCSNVCICVCALAGIRLPVHVCLCAIISTWVW